MMARPMKASGVDWIGEVPVSWTLRRGQQLFEESFEKVDMGKLPTLLSLTKKGIVPRLMDGSGKYPASFETYQRVVPGDFVFCLFDVAETPRTVGYVQHDGMITGAYSAFKTNGVHRYMEYMLIGIDDIKALQPYYSGMRNVIQRKTFQKLLYPSPTQQEQKAIASYLDDRTTAIDSKIQLLEEKSKALAELRKSVVHQAVTKGLDLNVAMKPSGVDWIGDVPAHWSLTRADRLFMKMKKPQQEKNVLSLSYGQVINKKIGNEGLTPENYDSYQGVSPNDIILRLTDLQNDERSIRVAHASLTGIITSAYLVLKTKDSLLSLFGYSLLHAAGDINKIFYSMGGGVRQTMKFNDIARLSFAVPSIEEQSAIIKYINERTAIIDESINTINKQVAALKSLRQSLIHEAVTGKIDVADYGYHYA